MENVVNRFPAFNPSLALGFKFQLLPGTEGFLIYGTIEHIQERTVHRFWRHVKN
jgi:hypothetical protein